MEKLTAAEVAAAHDGLATLLEIKGLPASLKFRLAKMAAALSDTAESVQKGHMAAVDRHAIKKADGSLQGQTQEVDGEEVEVPNTYVISPENASAFQNEVMDLYAEEVEAPDMTIDLEPYLKDMDERKVDLPGRALTSLQRFLA